MKTGNISAAKIQLALFDNITKGLVVQNAIRTVHPILWVEMTYDQLFIGQSKRKCNMSVLNLHLLGCYQLIKIQTPLVHYSLLLFVAFGNTKDYQLFKSLVILCKYGLLTL